MKKLFLILLVFVNTILVSAQIEIPLPLDTLGKKPVGYQAIKKGDYANAIKELTLDIRRAPQRAHNYYNRAISYEAIGKYEEALADYKKALSLDKIPEASYGIGAVYMKLGNFSEAIFYFTQALTLNKAVYAGITPDPDRLNALEKNKADTFLHLGSAYQNLGSNDNALKYLEEAIVGYTKLLKINPDDINLLSQRANCYSLMAQSNYAINDYSKILDLVKNTDQKSLTFTAYYIRAKEYAIAEDYENAVKDFDACLKINPNNATALFYRASCKLHLGQNADDACTDYKNAIKNGFTNSVDYQEIMKEDPDYINELFSDCK